MFQYRLVVHPLHLPVLLLYPIRAGLTIGHYADLRWYLCAALCADHSPLSRIRAKVCYCKNKTAREWLSQAVSEAELA